MRDPQPGRLCRCRRDRRQRGQRHLQYASPPATTSCRPSTTGDANNDGTLSACGAEPFAVTQTTPTLGTALSASSAAIGTPVTDTASLAGATIDAGGAVTYTVYTDSACTTLATASEISAQPPAATVTSGVVPDSAPVSFLAAGSYFWQAVYSGDANNSTATSVCTSEPITIAANTPTIATALSASSAAIGTPVTDSASLAGATIDAGGTVTYTVYTDSACTTLATASEISAQPPAVTVTAGWCPTRRR